MSVADLLLTLNTPVPRYTSYPTAPEWEPLPETIYRDKLKVLAASPKPLSLYFHIPFCKTMCLYCGCSVVLNRKASNEEKYVQYLMQEIELVSAILGKKRVVQIHFGGGTPTQLSIPLFARLFEKIDTCFSIDYAQEVAIEIDPRTVIADNGEKLKFLRTIGFNRVSFGVQDTDPKVQEAVKRRQSLEMTRATFATARNLGFKGINVDLIYGLPFQTVQSFEHTVSHILDMRPDRIAFFSYAKVPWLKPHQKAIREETLPSTEEKFKIYATARQRFVENGYTAIGMDHFALEQDDLAIGYRTKTLQRNFQGYSLKLAEDTLSFGVTSIGFLQGVYIQNIKELEHYYHALDQKKLPIHRGKILTEDDRIRKWVIHTLMCDFVLDKRNFQKHFNLIFDDYFTQELKQLNQHEENGLLSNTPDAIAITPLGELFIRVIVHAFDAYAQKPATQPKFSQSI